MESDDLYFKMDQSNSKAIPSITKNFTHFNEKQVDVFPTIVRCNKPEDAGLKMLV